MILKHDVQAREAERAELAKMAEQFIRAGGKIKQAPTGADSGRKPAFNNRRKGK